MPHHTKKIEGLLIRLLLLRLSLTQEQHRALVEVAVKRAQGALRSIIREAVEQTCLARHKNAVRLSVKPPSALLGTGTSDRHPGSREYRNW